MCLVYKERSRAAPCAGNVSMSARVYNVPKLGAIKSGRTFLGAHPSSSVTPPPSPTLSRLPDRPVDRGRNESREGSVELQGKRDLNCYSAF